MPDLPPDPRVSMEERIKHFKKQTQKLHLEALEAEADLRSVNEAVRASRAAVAKVLKTSPNRPIHGS